MKKLTIKNVALGLALAGYAASSAFALDVTTSQTIVGTKPLIVHNTSTVTSPAGTVPAADKAVTVSLTKHASNTVAARASLAEIKDKITLKYKTLDDDGDKDAATVNNIAVYYKDAGGTWLSVSGLNKTVSAGVSTVEFNISTAMKGATAIGYIVTSQTQYGAPRVGDYIATQAFTYKDGSTAPTTDAQSGSTAAPAITAVTATGNGGGGYIAFYDDNGGIGGSSMKAAIFKSGAYTKGDNYTVTQAAGSEIYPKLGDTLELVIWDDADGNDDVNGAEAATKLNFSTASGDVTVQKWYLTGDDTPAGATTAHAATTTALNVGTFSATKNTWQLPSTNAATPFVTDAVADLQGYGIKIDYVINP